MKKNYVFASVYILATFIALWLLFFIGEMLDVAKFGFSHWYDIPFIFTGLCLFGGCLAGVIYWATKDSPQ